jgi:rubrerythrin
MLSRVFGFGRRSFDTLSEQEMLALAISSEEDDGRIYRAYADGLREQFPQSAKVFDEMAEEEDGHRSRLIERHRARFGERIPLIRREHVRGYYERKPDWLVRPLGIDTVRAQAERMEADAYRFYVEAAKRTGDAETRKLLGDLAVAEKSHETMAHRLELQYAPEGVRQEEAQSERRQFILTYVQPGLAGLMDGSVSTLAPIFAAAFATQDTWQTFLVGLSASVGAGISMGFTEAAHDDGRLSGRGSPLKRGLANGTMTGLGGLGHTLPYLIPDFWTATSVAGAIVFVELWAIAFIQNRFMETPFLRAALQVVLGGALVFAAGVLIGNA